MPQVIELQYNLLSNEINYSIALLNPIMLCKVDLHLNLHSANGILELNGGFLILLSLASCPLLPSLWARFLKAYTRIIRGSLSDLPPAFRVPVLAFLQILISHMYFIHR